MPDPYHIVPVDQMPKKGDIVFVPKDNIVRLYNLCMEMTKLCVASDGVGLSAIQIGIPWKVFVIFHSSKEYRFMADCEYEPVDDVKIQSIEGCLSLRTPSGGLRTFVVPRYEKIRVVGQELLSDGTLRLEQFSTVYDGRLAVIYQHEIDHNSGMLISDIGEEVTLSRGETQHAIK